MSVSASICRILGRRYTRAKTGVIRVISLHDRDGLTTSIPGVFTLEHLSTMGLCGSKSDDSNPTSVVPEEAAPDAEEETPADTDETPAAEAAASPPPVDTAAGPARRTSAE